jgi:hypothetical protein
MLPCNVDTTYQTIRCHDSEDSGVWTYSYWHVGDEWLALPVWSLCPLARRLRGSQCWCGPRVAVVRVESVSLFNMCPNCPWAGGWTTEELGINARQGHGVLTG